MTCPDCGGDLDAVPVDAACPACGEGRREVRVALPTSTVHVEAGEIDVLIGRALSELAAMPTDAARDVVDRLVQLAGRADPKATGTGTALGVEPPTPVTKALTVAHAVAAATHDAAWTPAAVQRVLDNPAARAVLLGLATNALYDLLKLGVGVALGAKLTGTEPMVRVELHFRATAPVAQQEPAPEPGPPPSDDVCLPAKPTP